jgi:Skp family chaperone for outer membrane proteins
MSVRTSVVKGFFMKTKMTLLGCVIFCAFLLSAYEYTSAQPGIPTSKIGVMSVERVLRDCKATAKYREQMKAEGDKMSMEMDVLSKEIQALKAGLQLGTLKVGSSDYFKQHWELAQKQAELDARKEYIPNQQMLQQQLWTQEIYQKILKVAKEVGAEKELILVLEKSEPEFPIQSDFGLIIGTHKVLYSDGCPDITDDVIARMDAGETKTEN